MGSAAGILGAALLLLLVGIWLGILAGPRALRFFRHQRRIAPPPTEVATASESGSAIAARRSPSVMGQEAAIELPIVSKKFGLSEVRVGDRTLFDAATFILAARADMPGEELCKRLPARFTFGPAEMIRDLVNLHNGATTLRPIPEPPREMPNHPGFVYFKFDQESDLWARLESSVGIALHVTGDFPGLKMMIFAIRPTDEMSRWRPGTDGFPPVMVKGPFAASSPPEPAADTVNRTIKDKVGPIRFGLLETLNIQGRAGASRIELHYGDLTATSAADAVDVLVLSAFPDNYAPTARSLVGALDRKGISVRLLAEDKFVDLREAFSCWLSARISKGIAGINFDRILCYEPLYRGAGAAEAVGDIFRALAPFVAGEPHVASIAMPVLATGAQGYSITDVLPPLLKAAVEWLRIGLPLRTVKIYAHDADLAMAAREILVRAREDMAGDCEPATVSERYDAFISYAHVDDEAALSLAEHLKKANLRVFVDRLELEHGAAWQQRIFEVLDRARTIIALYSPEYIKSKVCQEEFNIAWARSRKMGKQIIFPIYWRSGNLPTYMGLLNFSDCRERELGKLKQTCGILATALIERRRDFPTAPQ